jgi:hypothetical protein
MRQFIEKHGSSVSGILCGWDRLVFRGCYRALAYVEAMMKYLGFQKILLKNFGEHAAALTAQLVAASLQAAKQQGRPILYLASASVRKEDRVRQILGRYPTREGLICVLTCVEPCQSFDINKNRETKKLELVPRQRKCLHHYHYFLDPRFGLMYARLQTWFPFNFQIGLNGREWLARTMQADGLDFERADNCFPAIADFDRAQKLMDRQLRVDWPGILDGIAHIVNPAAAQMFGDFEVSYYWTAHQTEWATDIVFDHPGELAKIYPQLVRGAMTSFSSKDVLRFLGRPHNGRFSGEITSSFKDRAEGVRVKHWANGNSVKMYDKGPNILRVETTINNPSDLKVYRTAETDPDGPLAWRAMRKGVADLHRRAELSQRTNDRYLDALAQLDTDAQVGEVLGMVGRPVNKRGRHFRALRVGTAEDQALLAAINRPEFLLGGMRNRDLVAIIYPNLGRSVEDKRRASARISYRLSLLRAHGLIEKIPKSRKYRTTIKGHQIATTVMTTQTVTVGQLARAAA